MKQIMSRKQIRLELLQLEPSRIMVRNLLKVIANQKAEIKCLKKQRG